MIKKIIHLIHILFVAPLLIYSGFIGRKIEQGQVTEEDTVSRPNRKFFNLLIVTGVVFLVYYVYKLIM